MHRYSYVRMDQERERKKLRGVIIEQEVYDAGRVLADSIGQTFSSYMRSLLVREIRKQEERSGKSMLPPGDY